MKRKLLGLLIATSSLLAISCSQVEDFALLDNGDGEEVTVSFSVAANGGTLSTRAGETELPHISDGTKATKLVYAVYSPEDNEDGSTSYYLLKQYGDKGVEGNGQIVVMNPEGLLGDGYKFSLRLMRGKTYLIAFWAQDPKCEAYNTDNLEQVTVDYTAAKNNDELRDAFSTTISFEALPEESYTAILTRAMAQINVGTAGWDYLEEVDYGYRYAYSKMEVTGVYDQLNVLTEEVSRQKISDEQAIKFEWNKIPAYINIPNANDADEKGFPTLTTGSVTPSQMEALEEFLLTSKDEQTDEEFLYVKLTPKQENESTNPLYEHGEGNYKNNYFLKYLETPPTKGETDQNVYTEVFKYLSMCYVLAPKHATTNSDTSTDSDTFGKDGTVKGGTTVKVAFYMAEDGAGNIYELKGDKETETPLTVEQTNKQIFEIENVPVQRNWRTNILGGTGLNGDDDDTSLFNPRKVKCLIDIDPGFDGEHNTTDSGTSWGTWNPDDNGNWKQTGEWSSKDEDPKNE